LKKRIEKNLERLDSLQKNVKVILDMEFHPEKLFKPILAEGKTEIDKEKSNK